MDWTFTEEQEQLAGLAREIFERELSEIRIRAAEAGGERFDEALFKTLEGAGLTAPGSYGLIGFCRVLIEAGRVVAPVPLLPVAVGAMALERAGEAADGRVVVPALVEESNLELHRPQALLSGGRLSGAKTTVAGGTVADGFVVSATDGGEGVLCFVDASADGVKVERQVATDLSVEAVVTFDGVALDETSVLRADGVVGWLVDRYVLGLCALQVGICERALELTAEYAKTRVQFDRPIATFQAVGQRLADSYIDVQAVRLTLWQAASALERGEPAATDSLAVAKFWACEAGHRVGHTAVHVHGGMGIDLDYHLNRYFVAAKRVEFALGPASAWLDVIGDALAEEPV